MLDLNNVPDTPTMRENIEKFNNFILAEEIILLVRYIKLNRSYNRVTLGNTYKVRNIFLESNRINYELYNDISFADYNSEYFDNKEIIDAWEDIIGSESKRKCDYCDEELNTYFNGIDNEKKKFCSNCQIKYNIFRCRQCGYTKKFTEKISPKGTDRYCAECVNTLKSQNKLLKCNSCNTITNTHYYSSGFVENLTEKYKKFICEYCFHERIGRSQKIIRNTEYEFINKLIKAVEYKGKTYTDVTKGRTFGLEFEVNGKEFVPDSVLKLKKDLNKEVVTLITHSGFKFNKTFNELLIIKSDGSLDTHLGIEFNTAIFYDNELGHLLLKRLVEILKQYFDVDKKCGLHIHIGVNDYEIVDKVNLYKFYQSFQKYFKLYVNPDRINSHYCQNIPVRTQRDLEQKEKDILNGILGCYSLTPDRYRCVNFHSLAERPTIEIRILEGTLDYENKILPFLKLNLAIYNYIRLNSKEIREIKRLGKQNLLKILGKTLYRDFRNRLKKDKVLLDSLNVIEKINMGFVSLFGDE